MEVKKNDLPNWAAGGNGRFVAWSAYGSGDVHLWDIEQGRKIKVVQEEAGAVLDIAISPNSQYLAWNNWKGEVGLWDLIREEEIGRLDASRFGVLWWKIQFSRDSRRLGLVSAVPVRTEPYTNITQSGRVDQEKIGMAWSWDIETQSEVEIIDGPMQAVFTPEGSLVGLRREVNTILLWGEVAPTYVETAIRESVEYRVPIATTLLPNYPNPFNTQTSITYELAHTTPVRLDIYNATGQRVRKIVDATQEAGRYRLFWDGRNEGGIRVGNGVYFYRLLTDRGRRTKKMVLVK